MRVEGVEHAVVLMAFDVEIVEQDAHAHAAVGRGDDALCDETARRVVVEDVVLKIERVRRVVDEHDAAHERVRVADQRAESRIVSVRGGFRRHVTRRRRVGDRRQRGRCRLREIGAQRSAAARECTEQREHGDSEENVAMAFRGGHPRDYLRVAG
jgi:hypothetical protein